MFGKRNSSKEDLSNLNPTGNVNPDKVKHFQSGGAGSDEPVEYIVDENGDKYIVDGNHRVFAKLANGETVIDARESDLPEKVKRSWLGKLKGDK